MPTVVLSPIGNDAPFVDSSGDPLSGGLLYFYDAGTTTPQDTYTTIAGSVTNANPVVLNANGYPASGGSVVSIWMIDGEDYKVELKNSAGTTVWTRDNITGINDSNVALSPATQAQQEAGSLTTVYTSPARQQYHPSAAKAWARMRYDGGGFLGSYGAASITDSGTGLLSLVMSVAMSSTSYCTVGTVDFGGGPYFIQQQITNTTTVGTQTYNLAGALADGSTSNIVVFGDQ